MIKKIERVLIDRSSQIYCVLILLVIAYHIFFQFFRLGSFPNVFFDEGNGMYDSWCLGFYGVDSHLMKWPVYLQGHCGLGQSVLYAYLGGLAMRIVGGFDLMAYRLPLALISIINLLLASFVFIKRLGIRNAFWVIMAIGTAPYLLAASKYGMDCNVSVFICSIGTLLIIYGCDIENVIKKRMIVSLGFVFLGLTAYSYNASWLFLPFFVLLIFIYLIRTRKMSVTECLICSVPAAIVIIPILLFVIRSNIQQLNHTAKFFVFTIPELPTGRRDASIISFEGNIVKNIARNLYEGVKIYINGSDGLSWNSVSAFGAYFMFWMPLALPGIFRMIKRRNTVDCILLCQLLAVIPTILLVFPNYNHWMFLHIPILVAIANGIDMLIEIIRGWDLKMILFVSFLFTYLVNIIFFSFRYFKGDRYTGWSISSIESIANLGTDGYNKVYFASDQHRFPFKLRFAVPVSPYEFQRTKDEPFSETVLDTEVHYSNFEKIDNNTEFQPDSLYLIQDTLAGDYSNIVKNYEKKGSIIIDDNEFLLFEDRSGDQGK